ncbi:phosphotransferase [Hyphomonas sp. WL0036]|uniref:aminoglycoside phosphotransferase family protein n=1 Tax=Hyphomonas sediminis TaxID=2866160 RepID=UPI001C81B2E9|nr:phosphotransferase [Hyphomonas sediminis]MBY9067705.1 phosphotransferase [Hyphomonas sediminis]
MDSASDSRAQEIGRFLASIGDGWDRAHLNPLNQDASTRRYFRLTREDGAKALLMDAPRVESDPCPPEADPQTRARMGWNAMTRLAASRVEAFALISQHLRGLGLHAPEVYAFDAAHGFALIEDFGEGLEFARVIERGEADERVLYRAAAETLAELHKAPVPGVLVQGQAVWPLLDFDAVALGANADLYADWLPAERGAPALNGAGRARWEEERDALIGKALSFPRTLTLRDYHAENLLWLPGGKVGLLDFQDAVRGWDAWDMAMLTQDARRFVSTEASEAAIKTFLDRTGQSRTAFDERLAVIGALNALRIAGVFSRLQHRDGKPRYGQFQPRQLSILAGNLQHPSLAGMRAFVAEQTPFVFEAKA